MHDKDYRVQDSHGTSGVRLPEQSNLGIRAKLIEEEMFYNLWVEGANPPGVLGTNFHCSPSSGDKACKKLKPIGIGQQTSPVR